MSGLANAAGIVPANLSFLAIYNPSLGQSDESLHEQIVYYYSKSRYEPQTRTSAANGKDEGSQEDKNERLRKIGLAQGMVQFAALEIPTVI